MSLQNRPMSDRHLQRVTSCTSYIGQTHGSGCNKSMVSPTGFEGFCKGLNGSWGIPFKGFVNAAWPVRVYLKQSNPKSWREWSIS